MDPAISQSILQDRRIAYAVTDRSLKVVEIEDTAGMLSRNHTASLGRSLLKLVPELLGSEGVLADILDENLPRFELDWINRETEAGRTVYLAMVDLPYRDERGQIAGLIHVVEDVTEIGTLRQRLTQQRNELRLLQRQLAHQNLELAAANAELRRLDEMKTMFVSVAAHELRTPLTSIKGYTEVLMDEDVGPLNSVQQQYLQILEGAAERLLHITNSLLDVTRIETGRMELVLEPTNLQGLVEGVIAEHRPHVEAKAQRLELHIAPDLPPALSDRTRAVQIVDNLISNATKYTPRGGAITVRLAPAAEAGFLQVSISDDGLGIAKEEQSKLFGRFFRAGSAAEAQAGGTGLGLYITRSLVEQHGGRIWFESELTKGSTFHVTFPIADRPA
jgi:signal transduction histidine kinase